MKKIEEYEKRFEELKGRIDILEASEAVLKTANTNLQNELNSLDQYGQRANILIRNIEIDENDNRDADQKKIEAKVNNLISKELRLPGCVGEIDKLHRVGPKKDYNNKKYQNIVVRFASHRARYQVY